TGGKSVRKVFADTLMTVITDLAQLYLKSPELRMLRDAENIYDVSLIDGFQDFVLPYVNNASKSLIYVPTYELVAHEKLMFDIPYPISAIPTVSLEQPTCKMDFFKRIENLYEYTYMWFGVHLSAIFTDRLLAKEIPGVISVEEARKKVALIIESNNPAILQVTPTAPFVKQIAGLHLKDSVEPLP